MVRFAFTSLLLLSKLPLAIEYADNMLEKREGIKFM